MSRLNDAEALIDHAQKRLGELSAEYERCLDAKVVSPTLRIAVKEILEHCRSCLDYVARHAAEECAATGAAASKVYFPIAARSAKASDFPALANRNVPGVIGVPKWLALFSGVQAFAGSSNEWLCDLADLVNQHKHEELVPQERRANRSLRMASDGGAMILGEGAAISLGAGAVLQIGGMTIRGGQSFGVGAPPVATGRGTIEEVTWVSFLFAGTTKEVLPLMRSCCQGVEAIVRSARSI